MRTIKTFFVTGGAGFIGSALVRHLVLHSPHTVVNIDALTYAGNLASLKAVAKAPNYHFEQVDIRNATTLAALFAHYKPDAVFHLAAESHVDRSIDGPATFIETNILGTYQLLEASLTYWKTLTSEAQTAFRFLHVSTDEVYGSLGETGLFSETTPYQPNSPYAASKAASDHLVRAWYHTYGLPCLTTNCSNNYGPYQFPEKLMPVMILKAIAGKSLPVYGRGTNVRDWLFVEDHVQALCTVWEKGRVGETYNIGSNNEQQNIAVVQAVCAILDEFRPRPDGQSYATQIQFVADRPGHDLRYAIDATKIQNELAWQPTTSWTLGLRKTVQWYLENEVWVQGILSGAYQLERLGVQA